VSIGTILLLFFASVLYARIVSCRGEASRERAERTRADEEFTVPTTSSTLVVAPPPYENPPSFEDAVKRTEIASATDGRSREERDERDRVAG